jgi:hypothetical protein
MAAARESFSDFTLRRDEIVQKNFEPQLARLGLSVEQIEKQNLEELRESLDKVNEAISHPENFGTVKLTFTADAGLALVAARQEAHLEIGILQLLLERKSLILSRIKILVGEGTIESLADLVGSVPDPGLRGKLQTELSAIAEQSRHLAEQESAVARAQSKQIATRDEALATLRAELFERRLKAWTSFFARESMATYVGAFLLIVLAAVQVVAMFSATEHKSEIISNAFLLLLGYFFGQNTSRTDRRQDGRHGGD